MTTPPSPVYLEAIRFRPESLRGIHRSNDIGVAAWEKHIGVVGDVPPLRDDIREILDSPCPVFEGHTRRETSTPILIPKTVNHQRLDKEVWERIIQQPLTGNSTRYLQYRAPESIDLFAPEAHWVLWVHGIAPGSEGQSDQGHAELLAGINRRSTLIRYRKFTVLEGSVCLAMSYIRSGVMSLPSDPLTYAWCQQKLADGQQMALGGISDKGFTVFSEPRDTYNPLFGFGCVGIL